MGDIDVKQSPGTKLDETCSLRLSFGAGGSCFLRSLLTQAFPVCWHGRFLPSTRRQEGRPLGVACSFHPWVHFLTFFLPHFKRSHQQQLITFLGQEHFEKNCRSKGTHGFYCTSPTAPAEGHASGGGGRGCARPGASANVP